jgi:hypothetical protein
MVRDQPYSFGVRDCLGFHSDGVVLPNGYKIRYPELEVTMKGEEPSFTYKSRKGREYIWFGTVIENTVQGLARCVVAEQMLLISKRYRPVLTVHDAAAVVVPEHERAEAIKFVEDCMSFVPKWAAGCPIACESGAGYSYGDC